METSRFDPTEGFDEQPYRNLAAAVLHAAFDDAMRAPAAAAVAAYDWLRGDDPDCAPLGFWCAIIETDLGQLRDRIFALAGARCEPIRRAFAAKAAKRERRQAAAERQAKKRAARRKPVESHGAVVILAGALPSADLAAPLPAEVWLDATADGSPLAVRVEREAVGACWPAADPVQWRHFDALLGSIETAAAHHVHAGHLSERFSTRVSNASRSGVATCSRSAASARHRSCQEPLI